jgi:hypothetical protein
MERNITRISTSELKAKEQQQSKEARGWLGGIMGRKKLQAKSPGSFFAAIINFQSD